MRTKMAAVWRKILKLGSARLRTPRLSIRRIMVLVFLTATIFGVFRTVEYRKFLRSRARDLAFEAEVWRSSAQSYLRLASQAEEDAERDLEAKKQGKPGVTRATFRFNRDRRAAIIRLRFPSDPPERLPRATTEFAAAVRADAQVFRRYAAEHDDLSRWCRTWGPWLPAWARSVNSSLAAGEEYIPGSTYTLEDAGVVTTRGRSSSKDRGHPAGL
jgi:hypothetical protein